MFLILLAWLYGLGKILKHPWGPNLHVCYVSYAVSWIHLKPLFISFWNHSWENTTSKANTSFPTTGRCQKHLKSNEKFPSHEISSRQGALHNSLNFSKHSLACRSWPYLEKGTTKANMRCSVWEAAKTFWDYRNSLFTLSLQPRPVLL